MNSWGTNKYRARKDFYETTKCSVDITQLFKADYNHEKSEVMIVPKTINAYSWMKNHDLTVYLQARINQSKPKKRRVKSKAHKRFYNQFSNNKNY